MEIRLVYFEDCPNWRLAHDRLRTALELLHRGDEPVQFTLVASPAEAVAAGLHGSPTILVNGNDPFPHRAEDAWSCRLYANEGGVEGAPSVRALVEVLSEATGREE